MVTSIHSTAGHHQLSRVNLVCNSIKHGIYLPKQRIRLSSALGGMTSDCESSVSASRSLQHTYVSKRRATKPVTHCQAIADQIVAAEGDTVGKPEDSALIVEQPAGKQVPYSWETEWYPLYLKDEIPRDAPLALNVFDRSLVLFYDGDGVLNCLEDRCPHRLAKLSEGQVVDGKLECLYHGWQFQGDGICVAIPQLSPGSKIPQRACARSYAVRESQGVLWVWMADKSTADVSKLPWFEHYSRENFENISTIHEMPYDYTILLENVLDPAHIPISHNRTDASAKREDAQPLQFEITESTDRGFAGFYRKTRGVNPKSSVRFESPCVIRNDTEIPSVDSRKASSNLSESSDRSIDHFSALLLCRPAGQGKSMLIARFGATNISKKNPLFKILPQWLFHRTSCTILEEDMGFLSSQNEVLSKENVPTKDLYLNLRSQDTFVMELRKWLDKVGHGLPYYWGHKTVSPAKSSALQENAPAGMLAYASVSYPSRGVIGSMFARDPTNRYFRHIVHCKHCRSVLHNFQKVQTAALALAAFSTGLALALFSHHDTWRIALVAIAGLLCGVYWVCRRIISSMTQNRFRQHRYS